MNHVVMLTHVSTRPGKGHTELEEELHETAHIDYDRVAIVRLLQKLFDFTDMDSYLTFSRLPTPLSLPFTKMPWSTRPVVPSHLAVP